MRRELALGKDMSSAHSDERRAGHGQPAPLSWGFAAVVIGVLSFLCWAVIIAAAVALWTAF
jgi:hypothetical protein